MTQICRQERAHKEHFLEAPKVLSETQAETFGGRRTQPEWFPEIRDGTAYVIYALALTVAISTWFLAIRAPLWLDETISFFIIKGGFREILSRQGWPGVPAYPYILWLWAKGVGTGEVALRISSVLAMLGAVYLLYRSARELFDPDVAMIAAIVFCLHPIIISEAIDIRPYPFAALAITSSIFVLVRLRNCDSRWLAALFGLLAACIVYFQFLFVVILPALVICFFAIKAGTPRSLWQQFWVAMVTFALAFLPVIPGLCYMFHTSGVHVYAEAPAFWQLRSTLAPVRVAICLAATLLIAGVARRLDLRRLREGRTMLFCGSLALVPILILYGVSEGTSIHIFLARYCIVAVPGIALCWAWVVGSIDSRTLRLLFCTVLVAITAYHSFTSPFSHFHNYSWKYALEAAENSASADGAPVLICSDLPESDYLPMPVGPAIKDDALFAPLSYYQLSVPVVPLPRALNAKAVQAGSKFLQEAAQRHERFLALAFEPSYETLDWLASNAEGTHRVHEVGVFDRVKVLEFVPRGQRVVPR
jgi:Dolichyl-phosphate-mannose-protein mannosyltransferase